MFQATLGYALMLAVMSVLSPHCSIAQLLISFLLRRTFQIAYFLSVIAGLAVGEAIFGRWAPGAHH